MFLFLLFAALCCCIAVCVLRSTMLLTCDQPKVSVSRLLPELVKNARSPPEQQPVTDVAIAAELMPRPPSLSTVREQRRGTRHPTEAAPLKASGLSLRAGIRAKHPGFAGAFPEFGRHQRRHQPDLPSVCHSRQARRLRAEPLP